ncbi:hypothetical protein Daesc_008220 [Daldinia eschscholtzii]|uniref:Chromo domain-containing protein n=1 Tax=Daldinia eschscholtzii TaxID=292717 RepID=A0AAX6MBY4_9PEZI
MAPTVHCKGMKDADAKMPAALAPVAKHALQKSTCPQRSSLRRAVRESLLDLSAVATITTPLSPQPLFPSSPPSAPLALGSRINTATRRSSLRRALKESLRDVAAIGSVATIITSSPPTPSFTSVASSAPSSPSPLTNPSTIPPTCSPPTPSFVSTTARSSHDTTQSPTFISPLPSSKKPRILHKRRPKHLSRKLNYSDTKRNKSLKRTELDRGHERSENLEVVDKPNINGIPTSRKGWYRVRSIINEAHDINGHLIYFVDWEGHDPRTGIGWPGSWVNSKNVSEAAIREWQDKQIK